MIFLFNTSHRRFDWFDEISSIKIVQSCYICMNAVQSLFFSRMMMMMMLGALNLFMNYFFSTYEFLHKKLKKIAIIKNLWFTGNRCDGKRKYNHSKFIQFIAKFIHFSLFIYFLYKTFFRFNTFDFRVKCVSKKFLL